MKFDFDNSGLLHGSEVKIEGICRVQSSDRQFWRCKSAEYHSKYIVGSVSCDYIFHIHIIELSDNRSKLSCGGVGVSPQVIEVKVLQTRTNFGEGRYGFSLVLILIIFFWRGCSPGTYPAIASTAGRK